MKSLRLVIHNTVNIEYTINTIVYTVIKLYIVICSTQPSPQRADWRLRGVSYEEPLVPTAPPRPSRGWFIQTLHLPDLHCSIIRWPLPSAYTYILFYNSGQSREFRLWKYKFCLLCSYQFLCIHVCVILVRNYFIFSKNFIGRYSCNLIIKKRLYSGNLNPWLLAISKFIKDVLQYEYEYITLKIKS